MIWEWDVFISYAREDIEFARDLARALEEYGLDVWFDAFTLRPGDSLRRSIDRGLSNSRFGVAVLSKWSLKKEWPQKELDALFSREPRGGKVIIPIWHNISQEDVQRSSPLLVDKVALSSDRGVPRIAQAILREVFAEGHRNDSWTTYSMPWPDGTTMIVIPVRPQADRAVCIGKYPITNAQYRNFLLDAPRYVRSDESITEPAGEIFLRTGDTGKWSGPFCPWDDPLFNDPNQPVVCVSHRDAVNYYRWVNRKMSAESPSSEASPYTALPTPSLWDWVAFGTEFPSRDPSLWLSQVATLDSERQSLPLIGQSISPVNRLGVNDLFGSVWQWCDARREIGDRRHVPARVASAFPVVLDSEGVELRGGSFLDDLRYVEPFQSSAMLPVAGQTPHSDTGFRLAATIPVRSLPGEVQAQLMLASRCSKNAFIPRFGERAVWGTRTVKSDA